MKNITKDQFDRFVELQMSGKLNMNNSVAGSKITKMSVDDLKLSCLTIAI